MTSLIYGLIRFLIKAIFLFLGVLRRDRFYCIFVYIASVYLIQSIVDIFGNFDCVFLKRKRIQTFSQFIESYKTVFIIL